MNIKGKKINAFGRSIPVIAVVLMVLTTGIASAAILSHYGIITGTVDVAQSVLVDGENYLEPNTYDGGLVAGSTDVSIHELYNQAEVPATVNLATKHSATDLDDNWMNSEGVTTTYWKPVEYTTTVTTSESMSIPATITVTDNGDSLTWTIDIDMDNAPISNGHVAYGLVISRDNVHPAFQVHSNDGTDHFYAFGTHLYSEWGPTINDGYNGWFTGWQGVGERTANNVLVSEMGITATGERYIVPGHYDDDYIPVDSSGNPDGIFTVTISKDMLGPKFSWAVQIMADTSDTHYPDAWVLWSGDATTFESATLAIELPNELTLQPGEMLYFAIANHFNVALEPGIYTITTTVKPVVPT